MKKAIIFHGTGGNSQANWFPWLKAELEKAEFQVWVPDLPDADVPDFDKYLPFIFKHCPFAIDAETILIGHSSGAMTVLAVLQNFPNERVVDICYLVGAFKDDLGWDSLKKIFTKPFDYNLIKNKAKKFIFIHSDNDPHCPLEGAKYVQEQVGGELILLPGQFHFSVGTAGEKYRQFPFLLDLILKNEK